MSIHTEINHFLCSAMVVDHFLLPFVPNINPTNGPFASYNFQFTCIYLKIRHLLLRLLMPSTSVNVTRPNIANILLSLGMVLQ